MSPSPNQYLGALMNLSTVDAALSRLLAERKKLEAELATLSQTLSAQEKKFVNLKKTHDERQTRWKREEDEVKDEREKLVARRKALATHNNYKTQQAGDREIEFSAGQLSGREEKLISVMSELEELSATVKKAEEEVEATRASKLAKEEEARQTLSSIESRQAEHEAERAELVKGIDAGVLRNYDRVREKFPMNPLVPLRQETCAGCYMKVGPQSGVLIARGEIVRCAGCGRILYLEPKADE